jgi:MFS family permease
VKLGANRAVLALSVARMGDAVGNSILFVILPLYVAELPAPAFPLPEPVRVGVLLSLYGLVNSMCQPLTGALSDHLGRRKILIQVGLIVMGLGTLGFLLAGRFVELVLLRSFQGLGVALTVPSAMALMAAVTEQKTRGGSMGIYTTLRMAGFAGGPLIGGFLYERFGFNAAFYAGAFAILLGFLAVQFWVEEAPVNNNSARPRRFRVIDRELLSPGILGVGAATMVMASTFSLMATLEKQFNSRLDQSALAFSIAFSALMVSRLLFQIPLGRLSDYIGRKKVILAGLFLLVPATALLGEAQTTLQLVGLRLMQGLASAGIAAPAFALAADLASAGGEGRQMSVITMGFSMGLMLGPLVAGILAVVFFELPFLVGGALALIGAWVVYRYVPETVHRVNASDAG